MEQTYDVLLVEDNKDHAQFIKWALDEAEERYNLHIARNFKEAQEHLQNLKPDILICDLNLPDGRGVDLLPKDKENVEYPIIVMSGYGDEKIAVSALKSGALDYIVKSDSAFTEIPRVIQRTLREWELIVNKRLMESELRIYRDNLEELIGERTAELINANEVLKREIFERERIEKEKKKLQEQLLQSQKMEAIGQLAGGIAHDFNNILTVIHGYSELILIDLDPQDRRYLDATEIKKATNRAAALTRQLLAFSRKQILQLKIINMNDIIHELDKMLKRIIGENIELKINLTSEPAFIKADPGQMESVLMNLVVNARDAMPKGGKVTINTNTVSISHEDAANIHDAMPGDFLNISVSDTGVGIEPETITHIFEPFFTTKKEGTGLGLSVVYGIIKQHGGWMSVYSEINIGTTFKMYIPIVNQKPEPKPVEKIVKTVKSTTNETILLVEDDPTIKELATRLLSDNGYYVVGVNTIADAKSIFRVNDDVKLLFTDVVLPDGSGYSLADSLRPKKPDLKVLLCSGYNDDRVEWEQMDKKGFHFIAKPYSIPDLLTKVRELLDS